jgi:hypothetical protein
MKINFIKRNLFLGCFIGVFAFSSSLAQTVGTLTFSTDTYAPSDTWGNKHVLAAWLENTANPSVFIKTNVKYGNEDDHLTSWIQQTNSNLVDAVTGATLSTYDKISVTWNGTGVNGTVVPDGDYNLWIEMGWGSNKTEDHAVNSFAFTKGPARDAKAYGGTVNFTNVQLVWTPLATLAGSTEGFDNVNVFPNPTTGKISINFKKELAKASVKVTDATGKTLFSEQDIKISAGPKAIDLSSYPQGIYFIDVESGDLKYNYKVLMKH